MPHGFQLPHVRSQHLHMVRDQTHERSVDHLERQDRHEEDVVVPGDERLEGVIERDGSIGRGVVADHDLPRRQSETSQPNTN